MKEKQGDNEGKSAKKTHGPTDKTIRATNAGEQSQTQETQTQTRCVPYTGMRGVTSPQCQSRVMARHSATVPSGQTSSMARQSGIRGLLVLEWLKRAGNRGTRR